MLTRNEVTEGIADQCVEIYHFADDQPGVRWRSLSLPYMVFDKEQRVSQAEVVENKRVGAALALIKAQQDASRPAATAHGRPCDTRALVGQCDPCNLARASGQQTAHPRRVRSFGARVPQHRDRAGDEQATDVFVAALAGSPLPPPCRRLNSVAASSRSRRELPPDGTAMDR